jgi:hypothetical protein
VTDQDVRRETADEIASALESQADLILARIEGLADEDRWLNVALARGYKRASELATQIGRRGAQ